MDAEEFRELVRQVVKNLPRGFKRRIRNVSIEVEDMPSRAVAARVHTRPENLLGLYQGVPLPQRSVFQTQIGPDRISIYQRNIEAVAQIPDEIRKLVRKVVMHEIGHYFGLNEEELRAAQDEEE